MYLVLSLQPPTDFPPLGGWGSSTAYSSALAQKMLLLLFQVALVISFACVASSASFCPIKEECLAVESEVDRWDCINRFIFRPLDRSPKEEQFVEFDCHGVGWGNSIRAYYAGVSLAVTTGRRLIHVYPASNRNFLPPNESVKSWNYGRQYGYQDVAQFDYAKHGQRPGRYKKFSRALEKNGTLPYSSSILSTALCGGDEEFLTTGNCMNRLLPIFTSCAREDQVSMNIPFFYYLFRRPGTFIESTLERIRQRLDLPAPQPGDHHRGLRSDGIYILALHFRRIPVGFEPLALELNSGRQLEMRLTALHAFWEYSKKAARQAKALAACRKQDLLIYFASDDVELRPTAEAMLSSIGRVVFGLQDDEVGHVSTQWIDRHFADLEKEVESKGVEVDDLDTVREKMEHSRSKQTYLGNMSMVDRHSFD